jgi:hypothetical protein
MLEIVRVQSVESADDANGKGLPPAIDVTLRNLGETVAVVTAAEVTIRDVAHIENCIPVTGGPLGVSFGYGLALPLDASAGSTYSIDMSQSIAPNEADRFAIQFDAPDFDGGSYESVLFAVDVRLQNGTAEPTDVGTVVVAYPSIPTPGSFPASNAGQNLNEGTRQCFKDNEAALRRMLALSGEKPEGLTEALLDAEPTSPSGAGESEEPDALTADEQYLLDGVRRGAVGCNPFRDGLPDRAIAGIECRSDDEDVARIGFYLFADDADMLDAYFARMDSEGVKRDGSGCSAGEEEAAYTPGEGEVADRHGCFVNDQGYANYRATISGSDVYIGILGKTKDMRALEDFAWLGNEDVPGRPTLWSEPAG